MADESITLVIKHLPSELTSEEQEDLLRHFGATTVKTMGNKGRMKHMAFASFADRDAAEKALKRLHQLEILGRRLVVEFSNNQLRRNHPSQTETYKEPIKLPDEDGKKKKPSVRAYDIDMGKVAENINSFARQWDVKYALDPRLEYIYPQPTVNILTNIANALASVPRFYVQVLHLMNKMNLPAPFCGVTPTPVLPEGAPSMNGAQQSSNKSTTSTISDLKRNQTADGTSTEESELESDEDDQIPNTTGPQPNIPLKRKKKSGIQPNKRLKLVQNLPQTQKSKSVVAKPSDVFEQPDVTGPKKIAFNLSRFEDDASKPNRNEKPTDSENATSVDLSTQQLDTGPMEPLPGAPPLPPSEPQEQVSSVPEDITTPEIHIGVNPPLPPESHLPIENLDADADNQPTIEPGGFGKFQPQAPTDDNENEDSDEEWGEAEFISSKALRKGRISSSEKRELSVFRNYQKGDPSTRLYIKNIAKQVTDKDLHYVFGRYVDWSKEEHKNMFDIRLMKEGRMKGQAFVTLPTIALAEDALADTHGFTLHGKPIAVQFARSAKPKEDTSKDKGKKTT